MGALRSRASVAMGVIGLIVLAVWARDTRPDALRFAVIGDVGTAGPGQQALADVMADRAERDPLDFVLTVGDNFYPAGVFGLDDPLWADAWGDVYDAPSLDVPFYPVLGNHDHAGFPYVQLRYGRRDGRWTMPGLSYSWTEELADGTEVAFFAIDTEPIRAGLDGRRAPETLAIREARVRRALTRNRVELEDDLVRYIAERVHVNDEVSVLRVVQFAERSGRTIDRGLISEAIDAGVEEDYPAQLEWLDGALAVSDAAWKIVYGHHPLYGHDPRRGHQLSMIERVEPILVRHGVDLYIAGHDHHTDLMKPISGVHYITSGGGGGGDNPTPVLPTDESYYVQSGGGFTLYSVSPERLDIEAVDLDGRTRYTLTLGR